MKTVCYCIIILLLVAGCKERYNPPVSSPQTGYLVVEGFINNGGELTAITLSRTTTLYDSTNGQVYEHNAQASIESSNNDSYPLFETGNGLYTSQLLSLNNEEQYRLHIITADGKEYQSDYTPVKNSPPIDSINWQRDGDGVTVFVNAHDASNAAKYYQWQYEETWEFHSAYYSTLVYVRDPVSFKIVNLDYWDPLFHTANAAIYTCWKNGSSNKILIGTSENLSTDRIHLPIIAIENGDQKLSVLYSIKIRQHAVSNDNYLFLQKMKRNTEQLGSVFDAQPSELKGNIHCISNPSEQVIGYMEVSQIQELRTFISRSEIGGWNYPSACQSSKFPNDIDIINTDAAGLYPTTVADMQGLRIKDFYASEPECVDCTLSGSNVKPDFWP